MIRSLAIVLLSTATLRADGPPDVAALVRQLGDPKFTVREAAQKELEKRGEGIIPELDRQAKTADAETAERIGKVRYALVGYKDDIRRLLADVHEGKDSAPTPPSDELRGLIATHQPGSGNLLLAILSDPLHALHRRALRTFVSTWDTATPDQISEYVRQSVTLETSHRPKFPAKVGAMISFEAQLRDGWTGWPQPEPKGFKFKTRTARYLDGKPYEKPFEYRYPFATVGWIRVGALAEGKHTIHAVMEYEFTQNGQKRKGEIRSKDSMFEVVSADAPDDLIAPKSAELAAAFHRSFFVDEGRKKATEAAFNMPRVPDLQSDWQTQVSWQGDDGKWRGLSCPVFVLKEGLAVGHLCFDVELRDLKTNKTYAADPICVRTDSGRVRQGYVYPRDVQAFAAGRDGFVTIKVVMKPSQAVALSDPDVKHYYPEPFESGELRIRVSTADTQVQLYQPSGPRR